MATSKANRVKRHLAKLNTKIKQRNPEDIVILEREIPHKAYGSILILLDGKTIERSRLYRTGLKVARNMPIFDTAAELPVTDPYVMFFRSILDDETDEPVMSVAEAQQKAAIAYQDPLETISQDALILALAYYTSFEGKAPLVEESVDDEEMRAEYGLPPALKRGMWSPLEQKLNHVRHMMLTDQDFAVTLTTAINEAMAKAREDGLLGESEEEEKTEDGFPTEPVN